MVTAVGASGSDKIWFELAHGFIRVRGIRGYRRGRFPGGRVRHGRPK
jgi:hypothetical protein